jgi:hypothetical protein
MVLKSSQLKQNCAQLRLQLKEKDHEIYRLQTLKTRYNEVSRTIYRLYKFNMSLEKPNENEKQMKLPYKIVFRRKEFFMDYDMYQKLKFRRQGNVVMCCLLRLLGIDAAKHCLAVDRVSGRIPLSKQDVEQICGMATKDFLVFKG